MSLATDGIMSPAERAGKLIKLYRLRVKVETEIAVLEGQIAAEEDAMRRAKGAAKVAGVRTKRRQTALCGTDGGYYRHRRTLKERACEACKLAHRVAERNREEIRAARETDLRAVEGGAVA